MRLIDADAAVDAVDKRIRQIGYENDPLVLSIRQAVREVKSVDAVPVVRCAVCRYFRCNMRGDGTLPNGVDEFECVLGRGGYDPMDFCNEGERKDGDYEKAD